MGLQDEGLSGDILETERRRVALEEPGWKRPGGAAPNVQSDYHQLTHQKYTEEKNSSLTSAVMHRSFHAENTKRIEGSFHDLEDYPPKKNCRN